MTDRSAHPSDEKRCTAPLPVALARTVRPTNESSRCGNPLPCHDHLQEVPISAAALAGLMRIIAKIVHSDRPDDSVRHMLRELLNEPTMAHFRTPASSPEPVRMMELAKQNVAEKLRGFDDDARAVTVRMTPRAYANCNGRQCGNMDAIIARDAELAAAKQEIKELQAEVEDLCDARKPWGRVKHIEKLHEENARLQSALESAQQRIKELEAEIVNLREWCRMNNRDEENKNDKTSK